MDNEAKILAAFTDSAEPLNAGKVAEATGIERKVVDKIMEKLKKEEKIVSPKRCYWTLA